MAHRPCATTSEWSGSSLAPKSPPVSYKSNDAPLQMTPRASAASDATPEPARKFAFRPAAPFASSREKTCRISVDGRPVDPARDTAGVLTPPPVWQPRPKFQDRVWVHVVLFALTVITTTL